MRGLPSTSAQSIARRDRLSILRGFKGHRVIVTPCGLFTLCKGPFVTSRFYPKIHSDKNARPILTRGSHHRWFMEAMWSSSRNVKIMERYL